MNRNSIFIITITFAFILLSFGSANADIGDAERVVFARYPAPSPDGRTLTFSWAGDIWSVSINGGHATRLTASDGYDYNPIWSPDGNRIAFVSDRYGSDDLFVMDADGGTPERITFASNGDLLSGWTTDQSGLLLSTRRGVTWPNNREPHVVYFHSDNGYGPSAPERIVPGPGLQAVMHPDGDLIAFHFGPGNSYREGYRGTHKEDIWLYRQSTGEFTRITENDVSNTDPQWSADGSVLYYRTEEGGTGNLWSWNSDTGEQRQVTSRDGSAIWHPKIGGPIGNEIVAFEWDGGIYIQDIPTGSAREIRITAWLDEDPDTPVTISETSRATEFALSPDGNELAFVVRGEIFCMRTDGLGGNEATKLTDHPARDWEISWYPRGDSILFTSDRDGIEQLYRVRSDDPNHERLSESRRFSVERLTHTEEICTLAVMSCVKPYDEDSPPPDPDEITIAYIRQTGDLWLMDGNGRDHRKLFSHWGTLDFAFSPDGRWLAYSRQDDDYNIDIFIAAVDPDDPDLPECPDDGWQPFPGGSDTYGVAPSWHTGEVNITRHPGDDMKPVWSPDGSKLGFTSVRNRDNIDAYFVFLQQSDEERSIEQWELDAEPLPSLPDIDEPADEDADEDEDDPEAESEDEEPFVVQIDFENIHRRARQVTSSQGYETLRAFSPDGEQVIYTSNTQGSEGLWQIKWTGEDSTKLTDVAASSISWHPEAERIFYLAGGQISSVKAGGGDAQNHTFTATIDFDPLAARMYKFNEVWRLQNRWFYDPNFHGMDWPALREEYEPIVTAARHPRDLNDAINLMLGRLNTSHLRYSDAGNNPPSGPETGYLGCGLMDDGGTGLLIDWITPDSPIVNVDLDIEVGDRIISINGIGVGGWSGTGEAVGNYWRALEDTVGKEIEIGIFDQDSDSDGPRWIRVTPVNYWGWYYPAYDAWMAENNRIVEEQSNGRLGYMHIRNMYEPTLERFEQDLYTVGHGKDGIIIDVRWNSGGWTTDLLLAMLDTRRHAYTQPRDGGLGYPEDRTVFYTTTIPLVVLANQWSYSNAEIFSHAIQTLDRGLLIGWPTAGGVISTGGTALADGSSVSLPRRGWWVIDSDSGEILFNMEHRGAIPDVLVDLLPPDLAVGEDPQIDTAIDVFLNLLETP